MPAVKPHEKMILIVYPDPEYRDRKRLKEQFEVSSSSIWHKISQNWQPYASFTRHYVEIVEWFSLK